MYQSDTEILYPMRITPGLRDLRGEVWQELVDHVLDAPESSLDHLAFSLLMVWLSRCLTCHPDSYRAMRGCTVCATQTVRRFRGEDEELVALFEKAKLEVFGYMQQHLLVHEAFQVEDVHVE